MQTATKDIIKAALRADISLSSAERLEIFTAIRNHGKAADSSPKERIERLLRRQEAASRFGVSLRAVDRWARTGLLPKVRLPGRVRCAGFREADVIALIAGSGGVTHD